MSKEPPPQTTVPHARLVVSLSVANRRAQSKKAVRTISVCLRKHWDRENVRHQILPYGELYTASRLAQERHLAEKESALVVILKVADRLVMSIVPARG